MRERTSEIWAAIGLLAQREGSHLSPRHACLSCVEAIGVTGAGLMVSGGTESLEPVYVTDSRVGEVENLQATLGQGPGTDALQSGRPILVGDLTAPTSVDRWPMFASEASRLGVCGMYSLPLALGAIQVGVFDLYNDAPGHLNQGELMDALIYADTALLLALDEQSGIATAPDGEHATGLGPVLWHAKVHQAAGMVSLQLGVSALEALARLRAYAYAHDKRLTDIAHSVVEGRLRLQPDLQSDDATSATDRGGGHSP
ncbi:MAG: ANTAR domain-containing protein [Mycobacterium sp.]|nr:ANTAR domain-containing protein [Mycobacterium sp.]